MLILLMLLTLLLSTLALADDLPLPSINVFDSKYHQAINTALAAAYKQSGLYYKAIQIKDASSNDIKKWAKRNDLTTIASVAVFLAPVLISHKIKFNFKNFQVSGESGKFEVNFIIGF